MNDDRILVDVIEVIRLRNGNYIEESKKTHKQRFLERNKYDPVTGTYETDLLDENGNKIRVPLKIVSDRNAHNLMKYDPVTGKPEYVQITRKTAKSKNWYSQAALKHEEGHVKQAFRQDVLGRFRDNQAANAFLRKNHIDPNDIHDNALEELYADKYAVDHVSKRSVIKYLTHLYKKQLKACDVELHRLRKIKTRKEFIAFLNDTDPQRKRHDDGKQVIVLEEKAIKDTIDELDNATSIDETMKTFKEIKNLEEHIATSKVFIKELPEFAGHYIEAIKQYKASLKKAREYYNQLINVNDEDEFRKLYLLRKIKEVLKVLIDKRDKELIVHKKDINARLKYVSHLYTEAFEDIDEMSDYIQEYVIDYDEY